MPVAIGISDFNSVKSPLVWRGIIRATGPRDCVPSRASDVPLNNRYLEKVDDEGKTFPFSFEF